MDIVQRLKELAALIEDGVPVSDRNTLIAAAAEITRLTAERDALREALARINLIAANHTRQAGDAMDDVCQIAYAALNEQLTKEKSDG